LLLYCTSLLFIGNERKKKSSNPDAQHLTNANIVTSSVKCYNQFFFSFFLLLIGQPSLHVKFGDDFIPVGVEKKIKQNFF